jgi:hypothetical protein
MKSQIERRRYHRPAMNALGRLLFTTLGPMTLSLLFAAHSPPAHAVTITVVGTPGVDGAIGTSGGPGGERSVGQWIEAACVQDPGVRSNMRELYDSYKSFCENSSMEPLHNTCFGKELTRRGFDKLKGRSCNGRLGISLKQSTADLKVA